MSCILNYQFIIIDDPGEQKLLSYLITTAIITIIFAITAAEALKIIYITINHRN